MFRNTQRNRKGLSSYKPWRKGTTQTGTCGCTTCQKNPLRMSHAG